MRGGPQDRQRGPLLRCGSANICIVDLTRRIGHWPVWASCGVVVLGVKSPDKLNDREVQKSRSPVAGEWGWHCLTMDKRPGAVGGLQVHFSSSSAAESF